MLRSIDGIPLVGAGYSSFSKSDLDTAAMEAGAPEGFFCPISLKLFRDPVMLPTGQTCALLTSLGCIFVIGREAIRSLEPQGMHVGV